MSKAVFILSTSTSSPLTNITLNFTLFMFEKWWREGARDERNVRGQDIRGNSNEGVAALRRCEGFSLITQSSCITAIHRPLTPPLLEQKKRRVGRARGVRGTADAAREEDELCGIAALPHCKSTAAGRLGLTLLSPQTFGNKHPCIHHTLKKGVRYYILRS